MKAMLSSAGSKSRARVISDGPDHRVDPLADHRTRGEIDQDGAEQRQRDADAAEDEVFPGGLDRLVGAVDADHHHGGERRQFDRHPHQADVVGDQRQVHAEQHELEHRVIESQIARRQAAGLQLVADIAGAERAGGEADEVFSRMNTMLRSSTSRNGAGGGPIDTAGRSAQQQRQQAGGDVDARRQPVVRQQRQDRRRRPAE